MNLRPTLFRRASAIVFVAAILLLSTSCTKKSSAQTAAVDLSVDVLSHLTPNASFDPHQDDRAPNHLPKSDQASPFRNPMINSYNRPNCFTACSIDFNFSM